MIYDNMSQFSTPGSLPAVIEDGAMIVNGKVEKSLGNVITGKNNYFQSYVSIKRGFKERTNTVIGNNNYFGSFTNIGHNCKLGDNCYFAPGTLLAGYVTIGNYVYLGLGVNVVQHIKIGNNVKVAAGNTIIKDIPDNTYVTPTGEFKPNTFRPTTD